MENASQWSRGKENDFKALGKRYATLRCLHANSTPYVSPTHPANALREYTRKEPLKIKCLYMPLPTDDSLCTSPTAPALPATPPPAPSKFALCVKPSPLLRPLFLLRRHASPILPRNYTRLHR